MKKIIPLSALSFLLLSNSDCTKVSSKIYKGKLEIKGICMNYTINVPGGSIDPSLVEANWTDESTGQSYKNVFKLGSPCTFPAELNAGDEFEFTIDTTADKDCAVCMAYYPTPSKNLSIKVVKK